MRADLTNRTGINVTRSGIPLIISHDHRNHCPSSRGDVRGCQPVIHLHAQRFSGSVLAPIHIHTSSLDKSPGLPMERRRNEPAASSAEHNGCSAHRRPAGTSIYTRGRGWDTSARRGNRGCGAVVAWKEGQPGGSGINVEYCRRTSNRNPYPPVESWPRSRSKSRLWIVAKSWLRTIPPIARTTDAHPPSAVCNVLHSSGC